MHRPDRHEASLFDEPELADRPLHIDRQPPPAWAREHHDDHWQEDCLGGQMEWCWAVPWLFQALAAPAAHPRMPAFPTPEEPADHVPAAGYWNALLYLLTYSLGWSRPDKGLYWWMNSGKPTDDLRLRLLADVWDRDGHLEWLLAWLVAGVGGQQSPLEPLCRSYDSTPLAIDPQWVKRQLQEHEHNEWVHPEGLHLGGHHLTSMADPPPGGRIVVVSQSRRRATFTTPSMTGWYRALNRARQHLPQPDKIDWTVDVYARTVGWLGPYRRSWSTGLWIAGPHRFHAVGN